MSSAVLPEPGATSRSRRESLLARLSVGIAFLLCLMPPRLLLSTMRLLVSGGDAAGSGTCGTLSSVGRLGKYDLRR